MTPRDDGLLAARLVDPGENDGDDGSVDSAIAIHVLYASGPQSPPLEGTGRARARIRSGGTQFGGAHGANGTVQRLMALLLLLVVAGCAVARLFHHDHGSYLPQGTGSGQGPSSIESTDAEPIGKAVDESAESAAATTAAPWATAPPSASPTSSASATASPLKEASAMDASAREAVAALERQLAELSVETAEDESPRHKAALLEELLLHHRKSANHSAAADVEQRLRGLGAARFSVGDVVEQLYNANTLKCRILYPFRVEELHFGRWDESSREQSEEDEPHDNFDKEWPVHGPQLEEETSLVGIRYTIVRLSDGMVVRGVPESFLRAYVPYGPETRALCNVGGAGIGEDRLLPCRVLEHVLPGNEPAEEGTPPPTQHMRIERHGEETLLSEYRVVLSSGGAEEEAVVPMDRTCNQVVKGKKRRRP